MLAISFNPGFALVAAAFVMLAAPHGARPWIMAAAAALAMWPMLDRGFGQSDVVRQMGLHLVLFRLVALNQVFGIAFVAAVMMLALFSSTRRNRYEDAAILLFAGAVVSALFVGDVLSLVALASLAGLAATWVVFASPAPDAGEAGVRLLMWRGLEGLLFVAGVAFYLSAGGAETEFTHFDVRTPAGACFFAALMIRAGAPLAHVWLKDAVAASSATGAVALIALSTTFGVYALALMFQGEPLLAPIGVAMICIGGAYAVAEDDLRRAAASAFTAQTGLAIALIGLGSPLAMAAACATAFASIFTFSLIQMALGAMLMRGNAVRASLMEGLGQAMPATACFLALGGLAAAALPGLSQYVTYAPALDSAASWPTRALWLATAALPALMLIAMALRPALAAFRAPEKKRVFGEAPFPAFLAMLLTAFFCVAVGLSPTWLYRLLPPDGLAFAPYTLERFAPQFELIGASGAIYLALRAFRLAPRERPLRLYDVDALYRGPLAAAGRWAGVLLLRVFGWLQAGMGALSQRGQAGFARWAASCDRPYADGGGALPLLAAAAVLVLILAARR